MEEEAPSRRSVAELAGQFKGPAAPHNTAAKQTDKPVRRRPPRTLQIPKSQTDEQEAPAATSPSPAKAKRNSALIEKLQANLTLSPSALGPKSPGFRLFPPTFTPNSPSSVPVTPVTTQIASVTPTSPIAASPLTEEAPTSFEDPPTAEEGSILTSINKNRARHSIRRRPPSRRHRKSSSGEEAGEAKEGADTTPCSPSEPENETRVEEEKGGGVEEEEEKGGGVEEKEEKGGGVEEEEEKGGGVEEKEEKGGGVEEKEEKGGGVEEKEGGGVVEEEGGGGGEDFKTEDETEEVKDKGETESSTCPEKSEIEEQSTINMQEKEEEKKNEREEGDEASCSEKSQEEKDSGGKSEEDQTDVSTEKEEKSEASS